MQLRKAIASVLADHISSCSAQTAKSGMFYTQASDSSYAALPTSVAAKGHVRPRAGNRTAKFWMFHTNTSDSSCAALPTYAAAQGYRLRAGTPHG